LHTSNSFFFFERAAITENKRYNATSQTPFSTTTSTIGSRSFDLPPITVLGAPGLLNSRHFPLPYRVAGVLHSARRFRLIYYPLRRFVESDLTRFCDAARLGLFMLASGRLLEYRRNHGDRVVDFRRLEQIQRSCVLSSKYIALAPNADLLAAADWIEPFGEGARAHQ
jgi:hypothetical protein